MTIDELLTLIIEAQRSHGGNSQIAVINADGAIIIPDHLLFF